MRCLRFYTFFRLKKGNLRNKQDEKISNIQWTQYRKGVLDNNGNISNNSIQICERSNLAKILIVILRLIVTFLVHFRIGKNL